MAFFFRDGLSAFFFPCALPVGSVSIQRQAYQRSTVALLEWMPQLNIQRLRADKYGISDSIG